MNEKNNNCLSRIQTPRKGKAKGLDEVYWRIRYCVIRMEGASASDLNIGKLLKLLRAVYWRMGY